MEDKELKPVSAMTIRPLRVIGGIVVVVILGLGVIVAGDDGLHRYRAWKAGGEWCATFAPNGSFQRLYGAEACGFE